MGVQRFSIVARKATEDYENISDSEFRTLAVVASYNNREGWCYPAYATIAKMRKMSKRTVIRHVQKLVDLGYLLKQEQITDAGQTSNLYYNVLDYPELELGGGDTLDVIGGGDTLDVTLREPIIRDKLSPHEELRPKPVI